MFTNEKGFISVTEKVYEKLERTGATACCVRDTYRHSYRMIHRFLKSQSFGSYSDIYQKFVAIGSSERQLSRARAAIRE
jgi:dimeric dUTPase (all-alpha-NTP-PPase superfamily)